MKDINNYILEKLKINKDSIAVNYEPNDMYLIVHKEKTGNEIFIYFDSVAQLKEIDTKNNKIGLKFNDNDFSIYYTKYIIKHNYIIFNPEDKEGIVSDDDKHAALLIPASEALDILKELKNNKYIWDWGKYFLNKTREGLVRDDDHPNKHIPDKSIEKLINKLKK